MYKKNEGISENDKLQNRFSSYVSMSIHRERMLYIKRKVRRLEFEVVLDEIHLDIADSTNFSDTFCENDSLTYALQKLSAKERHIFLTHVLDEKSFEELADTVGLGYKGVAAVYYRALRKIRNRMKEAENEF